MIRDDEDREGTEGTVPKITVEDILKCADEMGRACVEFLRKREPERIWQNVSKEYSTPLEKLIRFNALFDNHCFYVNNANRMNSFLAEDACAFVAKIMNEASSGVGIDEALLQQTLADGFNQSSQEPYDPIVISDDMNSMIAEEIERGGDRAAIERMVLRIGQEECLATSLRAFDYFKEVAEASLGHNPAIIRAYEACISATEATWHGVVTERNILTSEEAYEALKSIRKMREEEKEDRRGECGAPARKPTVIADAPSGRGSVGVTTIFGYVITGGHAGRS